TLVANTVATATPATVTNHIVPSSTTLTTVTLTNSVTGDKSASGYTASGRFTGALNCGTGYVFTTELLEGAVGEYSVAQGASCTASTSARPALTNALYSWYGPTYTPSQPFTATSATAVTAAHVIDLADAEEITVEVTLTGETYLYTTGSNFSFNVTCGAIPNVPVTITGVSSYTVPLRQTITTTRIPRGLSCTIAEAVPFTVAGATIAPAFVNGLTRVVADPTSNANANTFEVEYYIRAGTHDTAALTVEKKVTGNMSGHDASNEFEIGISCVDQSSAPSVNTTVKLYGNGGTARVTAFVGDECAISENTLPNALAGYKYARNIVPSLIDEITLDRTITVTNEVIDSAENALVLRVRNTVTGVKTTDANYIQGRNLFDGIVLSCAGGNAPQTFNAAENEEATLSLVGIVTPFAMCELAGVTDTVPPVSNAYRVTPTGFNGLANSSDMLTVTHDIVLKGGSSPTNIGVPIPTLDVKGLILLIGLMLGAVLWQIRRRRQV
ncbi:MAG: DUF5979 domain-containing protein, partial [Burkholderiales bacterium]|nr:DUF5979 domain-containing protein [Burkholderiales bacterium]